MWNFPDQGSNLCPQQLEAWNPYHWTTREVLSSYLLSVFFTFLNQRNGEGNGNPLQYSCLENPVDGGAWWAAVHRVAQSWTRLKRLSMHAGTGEGNGNPIQCSCLENLRDRGAWWAAIYGVAQSQTWLKWLSSSSKPRNGENFPVGKPNSGSSLIPRILAQKPNDFLGSLIHSIVCCKRKSSLPGSGSCPWGGWMWAVVLPRPHCYIEVARNAATTHTHLAP